MRKPTLPNEKKGIKLGGPVPTKPNESGGVRVRPKVPAIPDEGLKRPLLKKNIRTAPAGGGGKIGAVKANGGLGGGNNLTPYGKLAFSRLANKPRMK